MPCHGKTWLGVDENGCFCQFVRVKIKYIYAVDCSWPDEQLAAIPCAYGTAESMILRAGSAIHAGCTAVVTGASGGVGSALLHLLMLRGARIIAFCGATKRMGIERILAHQKEQGLHTIICARKGQTEWDDAVMDLESSVDVAFDVVGGNGFGDLDIDAEKKGNARHIWRHCWCDSKL